MLDVDLDSFIEDGFGIPITIDRKMCMLAGRLYFKPFLMDRVANIDAVSELNTQMRASAL